MTHFSYPHQHCSGHALDCTRSEVHLIKNILSVDDAIVMQQWHPKSIQPDCCEILFEATADRKCVITSVLTGLCLHDALEGGQTTSHPPKMLHVEKKTRSICLILSTLDGRPSPPNTFDGSGCMKTLLLPEHVTVSFCSSHTMSFNPMEAF